METITDWNANTTMDSFETDTRKIQRDKLAVIHETETVVLCVVDPGLPSRRPYEDRLESIDSYVWIDGAFRKITGNGDHIEVDEQIRYDELAPLDVIFYEHQLRSLIEKYRDWNIRFWPFAHPDQGPLYVSAFVYRDHGSTVFLAPISGIVRGKSIDQLLSSAISLEMFPLGEPKEDTLIEFSLDINQRFRSVCFLTSRCPETKSITLTIFDEEPIGPIEDSIADRLAVLEIAVQHLDLWKQNVVSHCH